MDITCPPNFLWVYYDRCLQLRLQKTQPNSFLINKSCAQFIDIARMGLNAIDARADTITAHSWRRMSACMTYGSPLLPSRQGPSSSGWHTTPAATIGTGLPINAAVTPIVTRKEKVSSTFLSQVKGSLVTLLTSSNPNKRWQTIMFCFQWPSPLNKQNPAKTSGKVAIQMKDMYWNSPATWQS